MSRFMWLIFCLEIKKGRKNRPFNKKYNELIQQFIFAFRDSNFSRLLMFRDFPF